MSQGAAADNAAITDGVALSATTGGKTTSDALELNGWVKFDTATVPVTVGADGTATITITGNLPADAWGNVDKVSLVKKDRNSGEAIHGEPGQGRGRSRENQSR